MIDDSEAMEVVAVADRIAPALAGLGPVAQGAVLADLVGQFLAGLVVPNDPIATEQLRAEMLQLHVATVRRLTDVNAEAFGTGGMPTQGTA